MMNLFLSMLAIATMGSHMCFGTQYTFVEGNNNATVIYEPSIFEQTMGIETVYEYYENIDGTWTLVETK